MAMWWQLGNRAASVTQVPCGTWECLARLANLPSFRQKPYLCTARALFSGPKAETAWCLLQADRNFLPRGCGHGMELPW